MQRSRINVGAMRFRDRQSAIETIHAAIDAGFNYIDTAPCYCFGSEEENSERWVGAACAAPRYRSRIMISAKCSPGNGGMGLGELNLEKGFGIRSEDQLAAMFEQSCARLGVSRFDWYHLWTTHTMEQFNEARKPGGWLDGVMSLNDRWDHLGITTHAETDTIIRFLESGLFESVTLPLNVVNRTRIGVLEYCRKKGICVIAMNPFAGGFLATHERLRELSLFYLLSLPEVVPLIGFTSPQEVRYAAHVLRQFERHPVGTREILDEVDSMLETAEPRCTSCGYCAPCPQGINVGACLSYYNLYKYLGMESARKAFREKQWEDGLRLDRCTSCGTCASRCPNGLPVDRIIDNAREVLYEK